MSDRRLTLLLATALVVACDAGAERSATTNNTTPAAAPDYERPAFAMNEIDADDALAAIPPTPSAGPIDRSEHRDSLTDGRAATSTYSDRSVNIFILPDGRVWKARLNLGIGGRCHGEIDRATIVAFVERFAPAATPDQRQRAVEQLAESGDRTRQVSVPGAEIFVADGCVDMLTAIAA